MTTTMEITSISNSLRISFKNLFGTGGKDKDPLYKETGT